MKIQIRLPPDIDVHLPSSQADDPTGLTKPARRYPSRGDDGARPSTLQPSFGKILRFQDAASKQQISTLLYLDVHAPSGGTSCTQSGRLCVMLDL
eukprot:6196743-Pleurochrysis_carterae.AAC.1